MDKCPPRRLHARPLPLGCRCCTLLRACAFPSLCRHAEPSPPSLPPCVGPRCCHAMRGYKRRPLPFICPCPHQCLPPVSHPDRASPLFLPPRRCQASSRAIHPRVQVPEHPPTLEMLPEAWSTSLTTGATQHHCRAPVRSATASSSYSVALPLTFCCRASAWDSHDTKGSTFPSSGRWALTAGRAMVEQCACTARCRASRERSRARSRTPSGRCAWAGLAGFWATRAGRQSMSSRPRAT
jgi:hypothetical protein